HQMFGVPKNFDPAKDDPTWIDWHPAQEYLYSITPTGVGTGSIIHGQDIEEEGYTVYHFWAWCPDDISQDPWQYNWVTNTQTITGGGDLPTGSHWDYDYGRWTEDVKDCMFAFDDPRFTEKINKVESDLITSSCGEAVAFNIKLIIDQLLLRLCETYYENLDGSEGGPPSNIGYGFDETVTSIMTEIDKSVHYEIGQRICDVCGETNDPEACIEDMDSCPPEAYEACVEDKLCDYAIGNFEIDNEILLDQEAKDLIKSKVSSCGSEGFEEEVLDILFTEYFSRIKSDKILDLEELFEDCFGEPNEFGDYIDCENSGNSIFEFTLYADQPVENSRDMYDGFPGFDLDVGHAFVSLNTNYGGSDKSLTYGFYPSQKVVLAIPLSPQDICDDSNHSFTSSVTIQISCDDFNQAISTSISAASNDYHLINYNCTDYAIEIANAVSLGVADTQGSVWFGGKPYGALSNPGDLGEDIKLVPNGIINPYGGNAPGNSCN
ncbi:MAG: hypothetical protein HKO66_04750, partial [Saprospiraceae bacterium]|nr:hypothetical protein [Saprospiraceae bacterium]